jgi:hypothetical protein
VRVGEVRTRLDSRGSTVAETGDALGGLVESGLLRVGGELLAGLLAESLASVRQSVYSIGHSDERDAYPRSDMLIVGG